MGHSAGGAAAARAASSCSSSSSAAAPFAGVVVVDATEGAGLAAIPRMEANLAAGVRPESFATERDAIAWALRSGLTRNVDAARVSVPSQLVRRDDDHFMSDDRFVSDAASGETTPSESRSASESESRSRTPSSSRFAWRTSLAETRPHWRGWFDGLSRAFLAETCPKLLVLVGVDRLDDELVVGQMSGKFQMVLFPDAGHAVHEDEPERVADAVAAFVRRYAGAKHVGNGLYAYETKDERRGAAADGAATRQET